MERFGSEAAGGTVDSVGARLRSARELAGMSLDDVCARTRVPSRHLRAIEDDAFDQLPAAPYSVGFAKAYAEAVGLDREEIGRDFRAEKERATPALTASDDYQPGEPRRAPSRWFGRLAWLVLILAVGVGGGYALWRGMPATEMASPAAPDATLPSSEVAPPTAPAAAAPDAAGRSGASVGETEAAAPASPKPAPTTPAIASDKEVKIAPAGAPAEARTTAAPAKPTAAIPAVAVPAATTDEPPTTPAADAATPFAEMTRVQRRAAIRAWHAQNAVPLVAPIVGGGASAPAPTPAPTPAMP